MVLFVCVSFHHVDRLDVKRGEHSTEDSITIYIGRS